MNPSQIAAISHQLTNCGAAMEYRAAAAAAASAAPLRVTCAVDNDRALRWISALSLSLYSSASRCSTGATRHTCRHTR